MSAITYSPYDLTERARAAARLLAAAPTETKDYALHHMADALRRGTPGIVRANQRDVARARADKKGKAFVDRLQLDPRRVEAMARAVEEVAALPDPVGEVVDTWRRP